MNTIIRTRVHKTSEVLLKFFSDLLSLSINSAPVYINTAPVYINAVRVYKHNQTSVITSLFLKMPYCYIRQYISRMNGQLFHADILGTGGDAPKVPQQVGRDNRAWKKLIPEKKD
ncbi:MAG: hypothetical protein IKP91_06945 [Bacteroidaceae bacterium]|nr:hypothetical protein [Bacteroidaceae bacterium]